MRSSVLAVAFAATVSVVASATCASAITVSTSSPYDPISGVFNTFNPVALTGTVQI